MKHRENSPSVHELIGQWKQIAQSCNLPAAESFSSQLHPAEPQLEAVYPHVDEPGQAAIRDHLISMLSVAVQLEFSTIPIYLCALWSIKNELHPVAQSIREIIQEEMLHMGLTCNMLAAIGGHPSIVAWAPRYPTGLPAGIHPGLEVRLQGLNDNSLDDFLRIESPAELSKLVDCESGDPNWTGAETIGEFYGAIVHAFQHYDGAFDVSRQISASLVWQVIASRQDAISAIRLITKQGEGAHGPIDSAKGDYAHYYRFLEIRKRKKLVPGRNPDRPDVEFIWKGEFPMPLVHNMGPVPLGGFQDVTAPRVRQLLFDFDHVYTDVLTLLERAWQLPADNPNALTGQGSLIHAIARMFDLQIPAKQLMEIPRPDDPTGQLKYGPQFGCQR